MPITGWSVSVFHARARYRTLTLSALCMACALAAAAQTAPAGDSAADRRKAGIARVQDAIRRRDLSAVPDFKSEDDPAVRAWIARAAARLDAKNGLKALEAALADPAAEVRLAAAEELGQKAADAKSADAAPATLDLAAALAGEKSPGVRQTIVFWLGATEHPSALAAVSQAVDSDPDANVRAEAAQGLARLRRTAQTPAARKAARDALKKAPQDPDERVRKIGHE